MPALSIVPGEVGSYVPNMDLRRSYYGNWSSRVDPVSTTATVATSHSRQVLLDETPHVLRVSVLVMGKPGDHIFSLVSSGVWFALNVT